MALVNAVRELGDGQDGQAAELAALRARIAALEGHLASLAARLATLEGEPSITRAGWVP